MHVHHGVFFVFGLVALVALSGFVVLYNDLNATAGVILPHEKKHTATEYKTCDVGKMRGDVNMARMLRDQFGKKGVDPCVFRQDLNSFCCDYPKLSTSVN